MKKEIYCLFFHGSPHDPLAKDSHAEFVITREDSNVIEEWENNHGKFKFKGFFEIEDKNLLDYENSDSFDFYCYEKLPIEYVYLFRRAEAISRLGALNETQEDILIDHCLKHGELNEFWEAVYRAKYCPNLTEKAS